ncbi:hypothetical protein GCM10029964_085010 [Kibdelosporangium lantanae]
MLRNIRTTYFRSPKESPRSSIGTDRSGVNTSTRSRVVARIAVDASRFMCVSLRHLMRRLPHGQFSGISGKRGLQQTDVLVEKVMVRPVAVTPLPPPIHLRYHC